MTWLLILYLFAGDTLHVQAVTVATEHECRASVAALGALGIAAECEAGA